MRERELTRPTPWIEGQALHGGRRTRLRARPAPAGSGLRFLRVDHDPPVAVPARLEGALPGPRRTRLEASGVRVSTVEHVLSALAGLGIWDAVLELTGEEPPALDGSALPFLRLLEAVSQPRAPSGGRWRVLRALSLRRGAAACGLAPAEATLLECTISFPHPAIGHQHLRLALDADSYRERLAPARSFGLLGEAALLREVGLARGASFGNLLVYGPAAALNPAGTRFSDEAVRHKLLDAVGDLALLGAPLRGRLRLERCGHALLLATLRRACAEGVLVREQERGG
jgi:UDP-3-O-[3-hydroxymyristoyl] N-acetylglucosamine deacetylase